MKKNLFVNLAAVVVIIAGLKASASILAPFLLSVFVSIILVPPLFWLYKKNIPKLLALIILITGVSILGISITVVVGASLAQFTSNLPEYQENLRSQMMNLISFLSSQGINVSSKTIIQYFDPAKIMDFISIALSSITMLLTNTFFIVFTVIFMIIEASQLPKKLEYIFRNTDISLDYFNDFLTSTKHYLAMKTYISLLTGLLVFIFLYALNVDFPVLWALITFLLNYIPNIGSIIAAVPPTLLALIQISPTMALVVAGVFLLINMVVGNIIEPKYFGDGLGMSSLVVFLSLIFWDWVLGASGMFLSIPLTMMIKIAFSHNEKTEWISILLDNDKWENK